MLWNINDITSHHRNIQTLMTEIFKIQYDLGPPIMDSMLNRRTICYNFRNLQEFQTERKRTVFYGPWNNKLPRTQIMDTFAGRVKSDVRKWICNECPCRLLKVLIQNLGLIWDTALNLVRDFYHRLIYISPDRKIHVQLEVCRCFVYRTLFRLTICCQCIVSLPPENDRKS